jgi:hypothetical protein
VSVSPSLYGLQTILIEVLDRFKPQAISMPALSLPRPGGGRATRHRIAYESDSSSPLPDSPASTASKRSFDGDSDQDFKPRVIDMEPPGNAPDPVRALAFFCGPT